MASKTSAQGPTRTGGIVASVFDKGSKAPLEGASVSLWRVSAAAAGAKGFTAAGHRPAPADFIATGTTGRDGRARFEGLDEGTVLVFLHHLQVAPRIAGAESQCVEVHAGCLHDACFAVALNVREITTFKSDDCTTVECPREGDRFHTRIVTDFSDQLKGLVQFAPPAGVQHEPGDNFAYSGTSGRGLNVFPWRLGLSYQPILAGAPAAAPDAAVGGATRFDGGQRTPQPITGSINVSMTRSETEPTADLRLWGAIRAHSDALSFERYLRFMDQLFCTDANGASAAERAAFGRLVTRRFLPFTDTDAYRLMKAATEAFVVVNCGVLLGGQDFDDGADILGDLRSYLDRRDLPAPGRERYRELVDGVNMLPYLAIIRRKLPDVPIGQASASDDDADLCEAFVGEKLRHPCLIELIWSYWHEEGMLVQTMNAISRRFQNVHGAGRPDPLSNMEVNPLRPLNNLLWGYIQDEQHRLTVVRRHGEYHHHYGLQLEGRAVRRFQPADTRSTFIEAFNRLLRLCTEFFKQDDQTTVKADAFGVLNALKELHLILSQGAHSQFGDLPPTARIEMLMQQWLLSRPEFREFLPTRVMVAYPEPWMDRVDAMKKLQGWGETSVMHFHNLAVFGEQILSSIRYGAWSVVFEPTQAFNFARFWRPQIQGYIHAYRAVTGVELAAETVDSRVDATMPSVLLQRRLASQVRSL